MLVELVKKFMIVLKNLLLFNKFLIIIGILVLFYVILRTQIMTYKTKIDNNTDSYEGIITSYKFKDDKLVLEIKGNEKILVNYYYHDIEKNTMIDDIHLGDTISITGNYKFPTNNTVFNCFNYKKYLYNKGIYTIWNANSIKVIKSNNMLYKIKDYLYKKAYNMPNNNYYLTLVLGDKSLLSEEEYDNYQFNGIGHLLSISGMHIGLLILLLNKVLNKFKYKNILIVIFLLFFIFITSESASIIRVSIYYILNLLNNYFSWHYKPLQLLLITSYILLIINPFLLYNIGFIYSFIVTFGIIYYNSYIRGNYFISLLKISTIAFLFSLPVTALLNYEINIMSIINNIILVPIFSFLVFPSAILSFVIPFLEPIFNFLLSLFNSLNAFLTNLNLVITIPKLSFIIIGSYYLFLLLSKKYRYLILILPILIIISRFLPLIDSSLYVYFIDVNQGDSTLIIAPNRETVTMIDTGGVYTNSQIINNTIKLINSRGISKIDNLIITHGDYDHMGEAINLVNNFKVEKVIFNCGEYNDLEKELIKVLDKKKIKYYSCIKEVNIDKNKLYFLQTREYDNENDNSNVIYTELNGYKFMFMGDASVTTEKEILNKYNLPNIDVLKVGHHGSKTSSSKEFIDGVNPKYSIISVGKNNRYGHPNKEVLDNLNNSEIYRTDENGSIMFKIKNNKLKIETCSP